MPGKIIIVKNHVYGKYKALEETIYTTPAGKKELRWKCENIEDGKISYQRPRVLKLRNDDVLMEDVVNQMLVKNNIHQAGLRKAIFVEYQTNARNRKHPFELTFEEFNTLITSPCHYCGSAPFVRNGGHFETRRRKDQPDLYTNGIDRLDSSIGYTKENCVPCCKICNIMKGTHSENFFIDHVKKIYNFNKGSETIPDGSTSQVNGDGSGTPLKNQGEDIVQSLRNIEQFIRERI